MTDRQVLETAANLTASDIEYVKKQMGELAEKPAKGAAGQEEEAAKQEEAASQEGETSDAKSESTEEETTQEPAADTPAEQPLQEKPQPTAPNTTPPKSTFQAKSKRGKRTHVDHTWPDVGTTLRANYFGTHYTAEVIASPPGRKLKSGKMILLTSGPASGTKHISMSGAMEAATQKQREDQNLGRKGCLSGWDFWEWE